MTTTVSPRSTAHSAWAFWLVEPGRGELRAQTLPEPGAGEVRVRALYSGISRGTESMVFRGEVPVSEYARMRAPFQDGEFPGPLKYGYASVGRVEAGEPALIGRRVFCLFPHQDQYVVPVSAVRPIPDQVPAERAVLAANMETAINGLWDGAPLLGERIVVVGAGVVGLLVAALATRIPGCEVELVDIDENRRPIAQAFGATLATPACARGGADRVFHCSGSAAGLQTALTLAGLEATVIEMSWFGAKQVPLALGEAFHSQRLTLRSSQVGRLPSAQISRWNTRRRLDLALAQLADPRFDLLISGETRFAALPGRMAELAAPGGRALCERVAYPLASSTS
ncbi:MAG: zinc-binding alcohol dehydrogenase [Burkholderiaceae bacterium]